MNILQTYCEEMRQIMQDKGLSVKRACRVADISEATWYNWERRQKGGTIRTLDKFRVAIEAYTPPEDGKQ